MTYSEMEIMAESSKGHVSNVKLFSYFDQARMDWYRFCSNLGVEAVAVHISVDYKKEVFNNDILIVRTWLERVGNTSFTLIQQMENEKGTLMAYAEVVLTTINKQTRVKTSVPDAVRRLLREDSELKEIMTT